MRNKNIYYKATRPDGWDFYTGHTINYRNQIGHVVKCSDQLNKPVLCSASVLHASREPIGVFIGIKIPLSIFRVSGEPVVEQDGKCGFKELNVLEEIPQEKLDELFRFKYTEAINPINPFEIEPPRCIREEQLALLKHWASVKDSVRASVRDSAWTSAWDSAWDSVWDSMYAYMGSLFPNAFSDPYQYKSVVSLWRHGIVPSYDGILWRLHTKNGIAWEGKV